MSKPENKPAHWSIVSDKSADSTGGNIYPLHTSWSDSTSNVTYDVYSTGDWHKCFPTYPNTNTNYYPSDKWTEKTIQDYINLMAKKKVKIQPNKHFAVHQAIGELLGSARYDNEGCLVGYIGANEVKLATNDKMTKIELFIATTSYASIGLENPKSLEEGELKTLISKGIGAYLITLCEDIELFDNKITLDLTIKEMK